MPHWLKMCLGGLGGALAGGLLVFLLLLLHRKLNDGRLDFKPYRDNECYGCANVIAGVGLLLILILLGAVLGGIGGAMLAARW